jgi:FAD-dependent oxidoreductase family protein
MSYDVVVVGGGAAGLAASAAAAESGARTALVERYGFLGGMATAGMVGTICGLYLTSRSGPPDPLNEGFPERFSRRLMRMPGCDKPFRRGRTFVLPYSPFGFACVADELTASTPNLDVYLHASLVAVDSVERRIASLRIATSERIIAMSPAAVVDCSGDAVVADRAGAATETPRLPDRQLPSLIFVLQHVEPDALDPARRVAVLRAVAAAELNGLLPKGSRNLSLAPSLQPGEAICKLALSHIAGEVSDRRDLMTAAEQEGRRRAGVIAAFLKTMPGFARAFVSHTAPQVGVREGRRLKGRYQLTREDVLGGRKFADGVARGSWPIELWEDGHVGATYEYLEDGQAYDIPLRCLQPGSMDNLFVAGRCISATHEALGSARVIGTCLATGQAAGRAAARLAESRP